MKSWMAPVLALAVMLAACSSAGDETTTTTAPTTTTTAPTTTTTTVATTTTTTTTPPADPTVPTFPEYQITERVISPETGDTVVLLLDPSSYTTLSDLDIYDVIADAVDRFPPIYEAHVVDSQEAAAAVLVDEPDDAQLAAMEESYLARLEEGFRIVYLGPFEESGTAILGS